MQAAAAGALRSLAFHTENKAKIAAAGAIPPLVTLLGAHTMAAAQEAAAGALRCLSSHDGIEVEVIAAGAIPSLVLLLARQQCRSKRHDFFGLWHATLTASPRLLSPVQSPR